MTRLATLLGASLAVVLTLAAPARAQSVEEFYRGRSITVLVGFTAGGGYDLYARLLGRHMSVPFFRPSMTTTPTVSFLSCTSNCGIAMILPGIILPYL